MWAPSAVHATRQRAMRLHGLTICCWPPLCGPLSQTSTSAPPAPRTACPRPRAWTRTRPSTAPSLFAPATQVWAGCPRARAPLAPVSGAQSATSGNGGLSSPAGRHPSDRHVACTREGHPAQLAKKPITTRDARPPKDGPTLARRPPATPTPRARQRPTSSATHAPATRATQGTAPKTAAAARVRAQKHTFESSGRLEPPCMFRSDYTVGTQMGAGNT